MPAFGVEAMIENNKMGKVAFAARSIMAAVIIIELSANTTTALKLSTLIRTVACQKSLTLTVAQPELLRASSTSSLESGDTTNILSDTFLAGFIDRRYQELPFEIRSPRSESRERKCPRKKIGRFSPNLRKTPYRTFAIFITGKCRA
jgi:hypothetical protein